MEKFTFDRVFTPEGRVREPQRAKRAFKPDEVEAIRAEAYAEGESSAVAAAEEAAARAIENLANTAGTLISQVKLELDMMRDDSTRLAATIARRFVEQMINDAPEMFLERCIEACLEVMHREPKLLITLPADATDSLKARIHDLTERYGLGGGLVIQESEALRAVSCRLDWQAGGATISLDEGLSQIDRIIEDYIASLHGAASPEAAEKNFAQ